MNVAYYKNEDSGVYNFYKNIIKSVPESKIILYNFSKLSGYAFTSKVTTRLIKDFPKNIVGMKDSTGNLWDNFKAKNFSMFVGSEKKLLEGLKLGASGCISATTNVTGKIAKKVFEEFCKSGKSPNDKILKDLRNVFDETGNLISAQHTLKSAENADLNLIVVEPKSIEIKGFLTNTLSKNAIIVVNKMDLGVDKFNSEIKKYDPIYISIKEEKNLDKLIDVVK